MGSPNIKRSPIRPVLVVSACAVTPAWLAALFLYPESWRDQHGYNQLSALLLTSVLHWFACVLLAIGSCCGILRARLPMVVGAAPVMHLVGSGIGGMACLLFFVAPSVLILVFGYDELHEEPPVIPATTSPAEAVAANAGSAAVITAASMPLTGERGIRDSGHHPPEAPVR